MTATPAQRRAADKHIKEKLDEFKVRVPKGDKERIRVHAEAHKESLNGFVTRAINETIERDLSVMQVKDAD